MTDVAIGAFTAAVAFLLLGLLGVAEDRMAVAAWPALWVGLVASMLAGFTGFLDWLKLAKGSPEKRTATFHMIVVLVAVGLFIAAEVLAKPGFDDGEIVTSSAILAFVAYGVLAIGGWLGGSLVFEHGVRVESRPETPASPTANPDR